MAKMRSIWTLTFFAHPVPIPRSTYIVTAMDGKSFQSGTRSSPMLQLVLPPRSCPSRTVTLTLSIWSWLGAQPVTAGNRRPLLWSMMSWLSQRALGTSVVHKSILLLHYSPSHQEASSPGHGNSQPDTMKCWQRQLEPLQVILRWLAERWSLVSDEYELPARILRGKEKKTGTLHWWPCLSDMRFFESYNSRYVVLWLGEPHLFLKPPLTKSKCTFIIVIR